jgi:hypothetical protein
MLTQGVTTEIVNADGADRSHQDQLERATQRGLAVNLGAQSASPASDSGDRRCRPARHLTIRPGCARSSRTVRQRCVGRLAGLDYKPAYFAQAKK